MIELFNRSDYKLREEQVGFRRERSRVEQSAEWNALLYSNFVRLRKAFDSAQREKVYKWKIMEDQEN